MTGNTGRTFLILLTISSLAAGMPASAEPQHRGHKTQPPSRQKSAPDITATIPVPPPQTDDETLPAPFNFPPSSRARMHACGQKWQAVKMSGTAADQTWREFATRCLTQPDEPGGASP